MHEAEACLEINNERTEIDLRSVRRLVHWEKIAHRNPKSLSDRRQARSPNAVRAVLVFLHLLECDAYLPAEVRLGEMEFFPPVADLDAYVDLPIPDVWLTLLHPTTEQRARLGLR